MPVKKVLSTCNMCACGCGIVVTVDGGVVKRIEGNPEHPTRGNICSKGLAAIQYTYNPNRIRYPMIRKGARGEGKWSRIPWDEALDMVADQIRGSSERFGPWSVLIGQGTGRGYNRYVTRLARSIGTGNVVSPGYVCLLPRVLVSRIMMGPGRRLYGDFYGWGGEYPRTVVQWGCQMEITNAYGEAANVFLDCLERSKHLIVIDPRATALTHRATLWLQIRPGTDAALALGMMHVIVKEGLYDREFCSKWTHGFEELAKRVEEYPPDRVSEITWIPEDRIVRAARVCATEGPTAITLGEPVEAGNNSIQTVRAVYCLMGLMGSIERPGGMVNWLPPATGPLDEFGFEVELPEESRMKTVGAAEFRLMGQVRAHPDTVFKSLKNGSSPIRVAHWQGGNPLVHFANSREVLAGLLKLTFISVADLYMSPTAEYADVVLPVATGLETDDIWDEMSGFRAGAIVRAVEPQGEAWPDNRIVNELGRRVAPRHWFPDVETMLDYQLRKAGITWKEFKERGWIARMGQDQVYYKYKTDHWRKGGGFGTPTGKFELYSTVLEDLGYDPLPYYVEPNESPFSTPDLARSYPLILSIGGRVPYYFHSQFRQVPWLREIQPYPLVQIHPQTASKYHIEDGDWVWIETPRGKIRQKAKLFPGIDPRVVVAQASWFYPEEPGPDHGMWISGGNVITSNDGPYDPAAGSVTFRALLCRIAKVDAT